MAGGGGALFLQVVGGVAWSAHSDMIVRLTAYCSHTVLVGRLRHIVGSIAQCIKWVTGGDAVRQEAQPPNSTTALWLRSFQRLDFVPGLRDAVQVNCAVAFAEMIDPPYLPRTFLSFSDADLYVITLYCTYLGSSSQPRVPFLNGARVKWRQHPGWH
jgi:hypothetical protein